MKRTFRCRNFTLVELLVAMIVLAIFMLAMTQFFGASRKIIELSNARQNVFERARIAMDMIADDIQSAYYSDNMKMPMLKFSGEGLQMVSMRNEPVDASCNTRITGIRYSFEKETVPKRTDIGCIRLTQFGDSSASIWGDAMDSGTFSFPDTLQNTVLIQGVTGLNVIMLDKNDNEITEATGDALPTSVTIELELVDEDSDAIWDVISDDTDTVKAGRKRAFTRKISLSRGL